ncbi:MAG: hypothetical protein VW622_04170, partial [Opitutae bacterium]
QSADFERRNRASFLCLWHKGSCSSPLSRFSRSRIPRRYLRSAGSCPNGSRLFGQPTFVHAHLVGSINFDSRFQSCSRCKPNDESGL